MGIVYKIEINDNVYYGSTIQQLCKRQSRHNWNLRHNPKQNIYQCCLNNGIEKIICIEIYNGEDYINIENDYIKNNDCLNMRWSISSKERINEQRKKYLTTEKGKHTKSLINKRYIEKHKEKLSIINKEYYENNKEKWTTQEMKEKRKIRDSVKSCCPHCNTEMLKKSITRHIKRFHTTN